MTWWAALAIMLFTLLVAAPVMLWAFALSVEEVFYWIHLLSL